MRNRAQKQPATPPDFEGLTQERIVVAALEEIDTAGLAGFSLRNVARALRVYPTALRWHVKNRDVLLGLVVAYATRDVVPPAKTKNWQAWLREMFKRHRIAILQHPNIAPLIGSQLLSNAGIHPEMLDRLLAVLVTAGFDDDQLVEAYNAVIGSLVGFITLEFAAMPSENSSKWVEAHRRRIATMDVMAFPTLAKYLPKLANKAFIVRWSNGVEAPMDSSFAMAVDIIVLGLEHKLAAGRRPSAR